MKNIVTASLREEVKEETKRNNFMINRELKMVEFKKENLIKVVQSILE